MKWIDYASPHTVKEAVTLLAEKGDAARAMAGGTDLIVEMRVGRRTPALVVDIKGIPELNEITYTTEDGLTLGAAVPCYKIYNNKAVIKNYPGLVDAASIIGGTQIQGRASIGGNLCNAAPSGDAIPALIALGAKAKIAGVNGTRIVNVEDFCLAPRQTVVKPGELLVSLSIPAPKANTGARYIRFIPRNEMDIAVVGVGVSVELNGSTFKSARVSLASVAPKPLFVKEAGDALAGKPISEASIEKAAELAAAAAKPISDMRGTAEYRKHLCAVLTRRALNAAIERTRGGTVNAH
ncbi:MAG: xanthine dehydrogenase family protein subunit M [SAR202 cluster bacterium]|nr:xanthine dehydrogenase family protein subunit M [SAR202 cluster bacterium]